MKKLFFQSILSAVVFGLLTWGASGLFDFSFSEWSFFIGLGLSTVIFFFSSSGGALSKATTLDASLSMWKVQKDNELKANVGFIFYGSALFTLFSLILMLVTYF
jgi:hypothetical protein